MEPLDYGESTEVRDDKTGENMMVEVNAPQSEQSDMEGTKPLIMEGTPPLRGVPYPTF